SIAKPAPPPEAPTAKAPAPAPVKPLGDKELDGILVDLGNDNAFRRKAAAERLAQVRPNDKREEVAKLLEERLDDPDHFTRQAMAAALGVWGSGKNVPALVKLLEHTDVFTRRSAAKALGKLKDPQAAEPLVKCFLDFHTRRDASEALQALGPAAEKPVLKL